MGCGAGVTAGSFLLHPELKSETICEIEPLIPTVVSTYFAAENYNVVKDPRVNIVFDDARHYVLTTNQTYDIITSDPINPWMKGAATLYTKEYFEMCKKHLARGHRDAVGAAVRIQCRGRQKPDRDVLRGLPEWHDLEQR